MICAVQPVKFFVRVCISKVRIPRLDCLISLTLPLATKKRQTPFLGIISAVLFDDFGIEHHRVCRCSSALVEKCDDAFAHTYHI